CARGGDVDYW
nr:immunoglobulin heavy chain junction region [Mus musculus]MBK4183882.1 immunoglobulin heavy chain junction region [Mus musculus]MBK4183887.1 immunoglobulin heavy chain junction region [Mus musculus]